ncbi:Exocyst subunit Exo70 family protein [Melia azedarach]|uniref:Exocyst subunit Exo70 family protein n=1 Tax=Melia azedarach TaxID=155640 RepID=A0ACC1Z186_MELAZ|nr:Exocyst subunit Exo70 family protein [Melia azedarach]
MEEEKVKPESVPSKDGEDTSPDNANDTPQTAADAKTDTPKAEETKANETETEIKEAAEITEDKGDEIEEIEEVKEEPPPEVPFTLETASEEIDKFITTLSAKTDEEQTPAVLDIPEVVWRFLDLFEEKIPKHEPVVDGKVKLCQVSEEETLYLQSVERVTKLAKLIGELKLPENNSDQTHGVLINRIGGVQQRAMCYLEDGFRLILDQDILDPEPKADTKDTKGKQETDQKTESEPTDDSTNCTGFSQEILSGLNKIAKEMISGGFQSECVEIYMIARRNAFDESLNNLGFEKISIDDVQKMHWETLEREIATWITTFTQCATVYFSGELKLAEAVFAEHPLIASSLFSNLVRSVMIQLLNFAEALAMTKRSAEKLFKVLDMYETIRDNTPALDALFPEQCANELKTETTTAKIRLGEAAICMFCDLENSIKSDTGKTTVPGGAVHPLTRYTMNYLNNDSQAKQESEGNEQNHENRNDNNENHPSPFAEQLVRVMDLLDHNLEAKSKLYRDVSLSSIFMMNNGRYILQKIKGSAEIHDAMGDTWCRKKSSDLRNYHKNYQRETWGRLLGCIGPEGLMVNGKVMKPVLKEKFKSFNAMFDEIHRTQGTWVVSDDQLQSELRVSISAVVIPAYRSFLGRFSQYLDPGRQTEKYIKFQPEDIETYIDELFDGKRKP